MLLTWYLIFILYILPSLVHFHCLGQTATTHFWPLYTFNRNIFFLSIFCLFFCYFDLTPVSIYFYSVFFSVCWTFTSILYFSNHYILFLTHIVRYKTTKKTHNLVVITNKTNYFSKRQTIRYNLISPHQPPQALLGTIPHPCLYHCYCYCYCYYFHLHHHLFSPLYYYSIFFLSL